MRYDAEDYEIAVIGGGHAGCEAALAAARKGHKTVMFSISLENIANMLEPATSQSVPSRANLQENVLDVKNDHVTHCLK